MDAIPIGDKKLVRHPYENTGVSSRYPDFVFIAIFYQVGSDK